MRSIFGFFIFASLVQGIRSVWDYVEEEQKQIVSTPRLENNFVETQSNSVITTAFTVDSETFGDYDLKKSFVEKFKLYKNQKNGYKAELKQKVNPQRKIRELTNISGALFGMECLSCYANGTSYSDQKCYQGVELHKKKCADAEYCFTEVHPTYLKRGCVAPGRLNRTFVCKCPLCNDKPSYETIHYDYTRISDWAYDNIRLTHQVTGAALMCKICETKGLDAILDKHCKSGKNSDYMACSHNQLCYTHIDDESDYVSRGCTNTPVFNSIYFFCNITLCNNEKFTFPSLQISQEQFQLKGQPSFLKIVDRLVERPKNWSPNINAIELRVLLLSIIILFGYR